MKLKVLTIVLFLGFSMTFNAREHNSLFYEPIDCGQAATGVFRASIIAGGTEEESLNSAEKNYKDCVGSSDGIPYEGGWGALKETLKAE